MKKFNKLSALLSGLLVLTLLLAGCGGQKVVSSDKEVDAVLQKIKDTKTLTVGTDATFPPFEFKNEKGEFDGFDVDLMRAVASVLGAEKVTFVDTEFKGLIPGIQGNKFDLIVSAMYITDERKKTIDFSDTYYPGGLSVMINKDNNSVKGIEDLKGKKVAVQIGTKSDKYLQEKYPDIKLVQVEKNVEMFMSLESGRADAVVTGMPAAKVYAKQNTSVTVLNDPITQEDYGYGIRKENPQFTAEVNKAIKTLKDNGKYQTIADKWFGK